MAKKNISFYLEESLIKDIKSTVSRSKNFRNRNEFIEYLYDNYQRSLKNEKDFFEKTMLDSRDAKRNTEIILQIVTALIENDGVILNKHYENLTQYKVAKKIVNDEYNRRKIKDKDYDFVEILLKDEKNLKKDEQFSNMLDLYF